KGVAFGSGAAQDALASAVILLTAVGHGYAAEADLLRNAAQHRLNLAGALGRSGRDRPGLRRDMRDEVDHELAHGVEIGRDRLADLRRGRNAALHAEDLRT